MHKRENTIAVWEAWMDRDPDRADRLPYAFRKNGQANSEYQEKFKKYEESGEICGKASHIAVSGNSGFTAVNHPAALGEPSLGTLPSGPTPWKGKGKKQGHYNNSSSQTHIRLCELELAMKSVTAQTADNTKRIEGVEDLRSQMETMRGQLKKTARSTEGMKTSLEQLHSKYGGMMDEMRVLIKEFRDQLEKQQAEKQQAEKQQIGEQHVGEQQLKERRRVEALQDDEPMSAHQDSLQGASARLFETLEMVTEANMKLIVATSDVERILEETAEDDGSYIPPSSSEPDTAWTSRPGTPHGSGKKRDHAPKWTERQRRCIYPPDSRLNTRELDVLSLYGTVEQKRAIAPYVWRSRCRPVQEYRDIGNTDIVVVGRLGELRCRIAEAAALADENEERGWVEATRFLRRAISELGLLRSSTPDIASSSGAAGFQNRASSLDLASAASRDAAILSAARTEGGGTTTTRPKSKGKLPKISRQLKDRNREIKKHPMPAAASSNNDNTVTRSQDQSEPNVPSEWYEFLSRRLDRFEAILHKENEPIEDTEETSRHEPVTVQPPKVHSHATNGTALGQPIQPEKRMGVPGNGASESFRNRADQPGGEEPSRPRASAIRPPRMAPNATKGQTVNRLVQTGEQPVDPRKHAPGSSRRGISQPSGERCLNEIRATTGQPECIAERIRPATSFSQLRAMPGSANCSADNDVVGNIQKAKAQSNGVKSVDRSRVNPEPASRPTEADTTGHVRKATGKLKSVKSIDGSHAITAQADRVAEKQARRESRAATDHPKSTSDVRQPRAVTVQASGNAAEGSVKRTRKENDCRRGNNGDTPSRDPAGRTNSKCH
ncbi:hypothetical protein K490DRAFT_68987 [Saccharata proteae CBS 121410]|uniref:Uncharacterized protein n=1 Tax=Saccharata proteae CBS 121410 TaxID=1314787 RepID=A0A9P4HQP9_9PEZI|nr:hypothetical protein K490DRAFT_68987 [Saccharata proteae CBS 121410]